MRSITQGDIAAAARAALARPAPERAAAIAALIAEAELADRYRRRLGRLHPCLGNGTLMAAALARGAVPEPAPGDPAYLRAMAQVIEALLARHDGAGR